MRSHKSVDYVLLIIYFTYSNVHGGRVLEASKLGIESIYVLLCETNNTLDVPQLKEQEKTNCKNQYSKDR